MTEMLAVTCSVCQATVLLKNRGSSTWDLMGPTIPGSCVVLRSLLINETPLKGVLCPNLELAKKRAIEEHEND
jgi:hypothetical protein